MDNKITVLKGAERVRRRPAVIFGDIGDAGVLSAVEKMIHILASECVDGYSNSLEIKIAADDVVCISNNGRGIYFGEPSAEINDSIWQEMFCGLFTSPLSYMETYKDSRYSIYCKDGEAKRRKWLVDDEADLNLTAVQYVSEFMDVISVRDGYEYRLHFEKGENVGGLTRNSCNDPAGTQITFKLDSEVFEEYFLSIACIKEKAELLALVNPGVCVNVTVENEGINTYYYPEGLQSYMQMCCDKNNGTPLFTNIIKGEGQDRYNYPRYNAQVEVGIAFAPNQGYCKYVHNQLEIPYGGTHIRNLHEHICKYMEYQLDVNPTVEELLPHLQLVVITYTDGIPRWENGTRRSIDHKVIKDMTEDTIKDDFRKYLKDNAKVLEKMYTRQKA